MRTRTCLRGVLGLTYRFWISCAQPLIDIERPGLRRGETTPTDTSATTNPDRRYAAKATEPDAPRRQVRAQNGDDMSDIEQTCPRCGANSVQRFYGPCEKCRLQLRELQPPKPDRHFESSSTRQGAHRSAYKP